ncbi:MAG: CGGC domain-containing protein [Candidatus Hydrothermarchaeales archaeon]
MKWDEDTLEAIKQVPEFVREKAMTKVEDRAKEKGRKNVTIDDVNESYAAQFDKEPGTTNVAVVRCEIVSEVCPGVGCLKVFEKRIELFKEYGDDARLVGFFTCGGCPGRRVFRLANTLKRYGIDVVHLSSCILMEEPFTRCPHKEEIKKSLEGLDIKVVEGTHHEVGQYATGTRYHRR